jgi:REP element-mobilizing transposase RayT
MPIPEKFSVDFCESGVHHVFNRTNNKERLFKTRENYLYFLRKYDEYLSPYLDTLAWCLIPNHFYLHVKVKIHDQVKEQLKKISLGTPVTK